MDGDDREIPDEPFDAAVTFVAIVITVAAFTLACLIAWPR